MTPNKETTVTITEPTTTTQEGINDFTVELADLKAALTAVAKVCRLQSFRGSANPIKKHLEVTVMPGRLILVANSLQVRLSVSINATTPEHYAPLVVSLDMAQSLLKMVPSGKGATVRISADELGMSIDGRMLDPTFDPGAVYDAVKASHAAVLPTTATASLASWQRINDAIGSAASDDHARPIINGVNFDNGDVTATDSYRLATEHFAELSALSANIDAKDLNFMPRGRRWHDAAASATMTVNGDLWTLSNERFHLSGRVVDGAYPTWRTLMPTAGNLKCVMEIDQFGREAVASLPAKRVNAKEAVSGDIVRLTEVCESGCNVTLRTEFGELKSKIGTPTESAKLKIAFDVAKFKSAVDLAASATGDAVITMSMTDHLKPTVFEPQSGTYKHLLMPVRASD